MPTKASQEHFEIAQSVAKPLAVTIQRACEIIGVGRSTMWRLTAQNQVKTAKIGRRRVIIFASLETLLSCEGSRDGR
jgi:excisionase family DNA binding protein